MLKKIITNSEYKNKRKLIKNTFLLYILTFSSYFFSFVTVPFQTRVLGPDYYGRIGFAFAFMTYFRLILDFGFMLSATEEIALCNSDVKKISRIVQSVNIIKIILLCFTSVILLILCNTVPRFAHDRYIIILSFLSVSFGSFLPDYLYRGLENMKTITIRTVIIKAFFVIMIFVFLREKEDYYMVPLFLMIGNIGALFAIYIDAYFNIGIRLTAFDLNFTFKIFKKSSVFFFSRIASTIYSATNTFLIGVIYPVGNEVLGYYTSADKLVNTARSGFSPIADSLYPYMVKNKDFKLVVKLLFCLMPPVIIASVIIAIYSEDFVSILFGHEFRQAGYVLRVLIPIIVMTPITYILGFPVLSPLGKSKHANFSIIYAAIFHIFSILLMWRFQALTYMSLAYITVISEIIIMFYRLVIVIIYFKTNRS